MRNKLINFLNNHRIKINVTDLGGMLEYINISRTHNYLSIAYGKNDHKIVNYSLTSTIISYDLYDLYDFSHVSFNILHAKRDLLLKELLEQ